MSKSPTYTEDTGTTDRRHILKEDVYPCIMQLRSFLGNMDYGDHFHCYTRPGQSNWEFHNKVPKDTFRTSIIGEVAPYFQGTRLGAIANYKTRKDEQVWP